MMVIRHRSTTKLATSASTKLHKSSRFKIRIQDQEPTTGDQADYKLVSCHMKAAPGELVRLFFASQMPPPGQLGCI